LEAWKPVLSSNRQTRVIQLYLDGGQHFSYRPNVSMIGGTLIFSIPSPPFLSRTAECSPAARIEIKLAV
jgi:hypothetical protein